MALNDEDFATALREAHDDIQQAQVKWRGLLGEAKERGWTNVRIGEAAGMTEAAIRMYTKRHEISQRVEAVLDKES